MPSHNSKYYKKSLKRNKVVSKTLDKFLKWKRDDNRCTQQAESSTFLQECSENDTHVISEDGSSSELAMETTIATTPVQLSQPATQTAASDSPLGAPQAKKFLTLCGGALDWLERPFPKIYKFKKCL